MKKKHLPDDLESHHSVVINLIEQCVSICQNMLKKTPNDKPKTFVPLDSSLLLSGFTEGNNIIASQDTGQTERVRDRSVLGDRAS